MTELNPLRPYGPIGSPGHETENHRAALAKAEREQRIAEASGRMISLGSSPPGDAFAAIADLLKDPKATAKRIADLKDAQQKADAATKAAQAAEKKLHHAQADLAAAEQTSATKIEREQAEHAAWLLKERSEIEHEKAAVAQLKAAAKADAAKAAAIRSEFERKQRAFDAA